MASRDATHTQVDRYQQSGAIYCLYL